MTTRLEYKLATPEDWVKIVKFIDDNGYFYVIDPTTLGGHWAIATKDGEIKATVWFFHEGPNAYVDYWVGGKISSITLLLFISKLFMDNGVRYVRGSIYGKNMSAIKVITQGFGALYNPEQHCFFKEFK